MACVVKKRKRIICRRCLGDEQWVGENWSVKSLQFCLLGQCTASKMQKWRKNSHQHLTSHQRQALLALFYDDDGMCSLCPKCFVLFTGASNNVRKYLSRLLRESNFQRSDFLLNVHLLSSRNMKNKNHSLPKTVYSSIHIFCLKENVLH